jgi:hypothetical protein
MNRHKLEIEYINRKHMVYGGIALLIVIALFGGFYNYMSDGRVVVQSGEVVCTDADGGIKNIACV